MAQCIDRAAVDKITDQAMSMGRESDQIHHILFRDLSQLLRRIAQRQLNFNFQARLLP